MHTDDRSLLDQEPASIVAEDGAAAVPAAVSPSTIAAENAAMTSFKRPPSLKPMIPICVYIILASAGPSMVFPMLPKIRTDYFESDTKPVIWASLFDSTNALIGMFTGGLIGLAADAYGRKLILLLSALEGCLAMVVQLIFGADNPWPYMAVANFCCVIGSTKVGNAAIGFCVIADLFEKETRLLPTMIYIIVLFVGVVTAPLPSALGLSDTSTGIVAAVVTLAALIHVWLFFDETLPPEKRKRVRIQDLENPLVPLKFVFRQRYLASFAILGITFMLPFYISTGMNVYYLKDKFDGNFDSADNGVLLASMAISAILLLIFVLPILTRRINPETIVLIGMVSLLFNSIMYCLVQKPWQAFVFLSPSESLCFVGMTMMTQMVSATVPRNEQGVVNGTISALKELSTITGPIFGSVLFSVGKYHIDREHPFIELPFVLSACVCAFGIWVILFVLGPQIRQRRKIAAEVGATSTATDDGMSASGTDDVSLQKPSPTGEAVVAGYGSDAPYGRP